jgi:hypothetical protein
MSQPPPPEDPEEPQEDDSPETEAGTRDASATPVRRVVLSGMAGAGTGSISVLFVNWLSLSPTATIALDAVAPWFAVMVGSAGPVLSRMLVYYVRYQGWAFFLKRWKKLAASIPDDPPNRAHKAKVLINIRLAEQTLNEILRDSAHLFTIRPRR